MKGLAPIIVSGGLVAAVMGLTLGLSTSATAQSQGASGTIAENDAILIDGKTFGITSGKVKGDGSLPIKTSLAQELGPGAIIFRVNQKLYIVNAPPPLKIGGPARPSEYAGGDEAQSDRVRIEYEPPKNPKHQMLYEMIKEHRALEMLQGMLAPIRFPVELTIKTMGCDGLINSWFSYDDSIPTVHMCYELLQDIMKTMPARNTPVLGVTPHEVVIGQFLFWSLHEVGHAVFHIFKVPLFGREEDAADQFSVYVMLHFGKDQGHRWVEGAAYAAHEFVMDYEENPEVHKRLEKFASVHGLPEQRFYNGLCLAYGADAKLFAELVSTGLLPTVRAQSCEHEYQTFDYAFKTEIRPHIDRQMAKAVLNMTWFPEQPSRPPAKLRAVLAASL